MKVLSICGSPREGNSEAILKRIKKLLEKKDIENEIILLRKKNIERCDGCVGHCNKNLKCSKRDDMDEIMDKMLKADGYVFIFPNYFKMPPGIFKDFIDRCSVFYTAETDFSKKRAIVITVGTDEIENIDVALNNVAENFCGVLGIKVVDKRSFKSVSELKGNLNDIFENNLNKNIEKDINDMADNLVKSLE